ncbi:MAG: hypothetical protein NC409_11660 [Clostridium sp.]|nr:hypothetical protein [Clostridium sp.]
MKIRRFRAYGEKEDLRAVFEEFQDRLEIYYVPAYSDIGKTSYNGIRDIENVGVNFQGSHIGNMQMLIFLKDTECLWKAYQYKCDDGRGVTRYSALGNENVACICVDFNGVYHENAIFPTEISTMHYDDRTAKRIYDELKKVFRKQAVKNVKGVYICSQAYAHKGNYRFCTIDINSPLEYDLKFE